MIRFFYFKVLRYPSRMLGAVVATAFAFEFLFVNGTDKIYYHVNKGKLFKDILPSIQPKEEEDSE